MSASGGINSQAAHQVCFYPTYLFVRGKWGSYIGNCNTFSEKTP